MTTEILDFNEDYDNLMISKNNQESEESVKQIKANLIKDEERKKRKSMIIKINKLEGIDLKEYEYAPYNKTIFTKEPEVKYIYNTQLFTKILKDV